MGAMNNAMETETLRLPKEIKAEISRTAEGIGEKRTTTIRLALKKGLPLLLKDFGSEESSNGKTIESSMAPYALVGNKGK